MFSRAWLELHFRLNFRLVNSLVTFVVIGQIWLHSSLVLPELYAILQVQAEIFFVQNRKRMRV